jgi:hypothetical protein
MHRTVPAGVGAGAREGAAMPARVLFLDFDGVLNTEQHLHRVYRTVTQLRHSEWRLLDRAHIDVLDRLLDEAPNVHVVVSSSWRYELDRTQLAEVLGEAGLRNVERVVDVIPDLDQPRHEEIQAWLDAHPETAAFAILDDIEDMGHLSDHHLRTDAAVGLQPMHIEETHSLLKRPR